MVDIKIAETQLTEAEIAAATSVLRSGALREGAECAAFEAAFAERTDARFAVCCASGSAGLQMVYTALFSPGDEVLVPSFTFVATASMAALSGFKPVFCDIDPGTFLIDLEDAAGKLTQRTRGICAVHLFGNPCDTDAVAAFAADRGLALVWDAAQAQGARFRGKDVGASPDAVVYSFYPTKGLFVGEGGMVCTGDEGLARELRLLRNHGDEGRYHHVRLGFNYRMTDAEAAIGRAQLLRFDAMFERRAANAARLSEGLAPLPGIHLQQITEYGESAWHQFALLVDPELFGCTRDGLAGALAGAGIASGIHYPRGLHRQPAFADWVGETELPVTDTVAAGILTLPVHHGLSQDDLARIVDAVHHAQSMQTAVG